MIHRLEHAVNFILDTPRSRFGGNRCEAPPADGRGGESRTTPTRKAKPAGVLGAEIWVSILPVGQPTPTDPASFNFVALDTRTPYTLDFAGADGGKNASYLLRWVNPTGEKGAVERDGHGDDWD